MKFAKYLRTLILKNMSEKLLLLIPEIQNFWTKKGSKKVLISELNDAVNPLTTNVSHYIETGQLICNTNRLTGFDMMGNIGR